MDDVDRRAFIGAMPIFAETLDDEALDHLAAESSLAFFPRGSFLMSEGEFGKAMFAVVSGSVAVTLADPDGRAHEVAIVEPQSIVGEIALVTGQRRSATVVANSDVVAVAIPKYALEEMFAKSPGLVDRLGDMLAGRQAGLRRVEAEAAEERGMAARLRRFFSRSRR
ncbi:MAG: cyclic nucleotide-binding domain-containing protein [Rhizobiales bacterium]|nr:cyclic nucleotide-binding domain-containing protein [Hyphomicrobiales bacterium]MBN9011017.1 cyclic nucleotide-binding domain-containing protein [Hyphomicrobiales bacterium]